MTHTIDDGVIKYQKSKLGSSPLIEEEFADLEQWRKKLFQWKLIGEYPVEMVGFGNMSQKKDYKKTFNSNNPQFVITGTQTGKWEHLNGMHYTRVVNFDLQKNLVVVDGPIDASSEALTHGAIYLSHPSIQTVFHIHHKDIWKELLLKNSPKTGAQTPYGTFEMAMEVKTLVHHLFETHSPNHKFAFTIVMEGHEDGVIIFGSDPDTVGLETLALTQFIKR